jgi:hypothetical protein
MAFASAHLPSGRTPSSPTFMNTADCIERGLLQDAHSIWGFVVFLTPTPNASTEEAIRILFHCARTNLKTHNGLDLLPSMHMTVVQDSSLNNSSAVRAGFRSWCDANIHEQGDEARARDGPMGCQSQRYRYCIWIDDESLASFSNYDSTAHINDDVFVKLVWKDWVPSVPNPRSTIVADEIEGSTQDDVGWMKVAVTSVVDLYVLLRDWDDWYREYRRPPEIVCR